MNIELHILVGQPRGKRELKVIDAFGTRSGLVAARKKVKPKDWTFIGEINTNGVHLKNRRHFTVAESAEPAKPEENDPPKE